MFCGTSLSQIWYAAYIMSCKFMDVCVCVWWLYITNAGERLNKNVFSRYFYTINVATFVSMTV